jgi:hypothetical protein
MQRAASLLKPNRLMAASMAALRDRWHAGPIPCWKDYLRATAE